MNPIKYFSLYDDSIRTIATDHTIINSDTMITQENKNRIIKEANDLYAENIDGKWGSTCMSRAEFNSIQRGKQEAYFQGSISMISREKRYEARINEMQLHIDKLNEHAKLLNKLNLELEEESKHLKKECNEWAELAAKFQDQARKLMTNSNDEIDINYDLHEGRGDNNFLL